jgi:hypothetical protein
VKGVFELTPDEVHQELEQLLDTEIVTRDMSQFTTEEMLADHADIMRNLAEETNGDSDIDRIGRLFDLDVRNVIETELAKRNVTIPQGV